MMRAIRRGRGFTLLEVLIALLIFTLGLLGMAGLLIVSVKVNHGAYLRTQASFLAQSMADRMRANTPRVWTDDYSTAYPTADADPCAGGGACSRTDIATRDRAQWSLQLRDQLPNASADIACNEDPDVSISAGDAANGAPYAGTCDLTITWSESRLDRSTDSSPQEQKFQWTFQP